MGQENLIEVLDEELDNCIKKLRTAVYGYEVRTFITEYEELMLKKSRVVTEEFMKKEKIKTNSRSSLFEEKKEPHQKLTKISVSDVALVVAIANLLFILFVEFVIK